MIRIRRVGMLLVLMLAMTATGTAIAPTAEAAGGYSTVHVSLSPTVIHRGGSATISGYVSPNVKGHVVILQRYYSGAWHNMQSVHLNYLSRFRFNVTGLGGRYTYRVYHPIQSGWHSWRSANMILTVQNLQTITVASYATTGDWQGPTVRIPVTAYTLTYQYSCGEPYSNFLSISWNGQSRWENVWVEPANGYSGSGTWYGHSGAQSGYFNIGTQASCSWSFQVTYRAWR